VFVCFFAFAVASSDSRQRVATAKAKKQTNTLTGGLQQQKRQHQSLFPHDDEENEWEDKPLSLLLLDSILCEKDYHHRHHPKGTEKLVTLWKDFLIQRNPDAKGWTHSRAVICRRRLAGSSHKHTVWGWLIEMMADSTRFTRRQMPAYKLITDRKENPSLKSLYPFSLSFVSPTRFSIPIFFLPIIFFLLVVVATS